MGHTDVDAEDTPRGNRKPPGAHSPHAGPSGGQGRPGQQPAQEGRLGTRASSRPGTPPPEQPGPAGPRHRLVFLSVFAASSLLHVRVREVREREAGDAGGGDAEPGVGGGVRPDRKSVV